MIWRVGALAGALASVAAAAATTKGDNAVATEPVIWHLLGYPYEAGSMIAALCACAAVRFYTVQREAGTHRWVLDFPVSALSLMFTAAAIITARPQPLTALIYGTGLGAVGAGVIKLAKGYVDRWLGEADKPAT